MKKRRCKAIVSRIVLGAALGLVPLAPVAQADQVVTSNVLLLDGTVGSIDLTGVVHVVAQVDIPLSPTDPCKLVVYANLPAADVTATGSDGTRYVVHGAGKVTTPTFGAKPQDVST